MQETLKRNAILTLVFSGFFYIFFMHVKHVHDLAQINPFANDPYDATGSVAMILAGLLAMVGTLRAFFPHMERVSDDKRLRYIFRIQACVPLSSLVYLFAAAIALVRHVSLWYPSLSGRLLVLECFCMLVLTLVILVWVLKPANIRLHDLRLSWRRPISAIAVSALFLAFYPEWVNHSLLGALVAIVVGVLFLNVCLQALTIWLFPYLSSEIQELPPNRNRAIKKAAYWGIATAIGLLLGAGTLLSELIAGGSGPSVNQLLLIAIYLGAGTFSIVVSYGFLRKPLGLG